MPEVNIPSNKFKEIFFDRAGNQKTFEEAIDELIGIALSGAMDKIQLQALMYLFDRLLGKPAIAEALEHEGTVEVNITRRDGRSKDRLEEIKANAKIKWAEAKTEQDDDSEEDSEGDNEVEIVDDGAGS